MNRIKRILVTYKNGITFPLNNQSTDPNYNGMQVIAIGLINETTNQVIIKVDDIKKIEIVYE
jgi:hypothetical protein